MPLTRRRWVAVAFVVALVACRGAEFGGAEFGAGGGTPAQVVPGDGGAIGDPKQHPPAACSGVAPPEEGSDCSTETITTFGHWDGTCEYGHDIAGDCNDVFECTGVWRKRSGNACAGRCPEAIEEIVPGSACKTKPFRGVSDVACSYLEGTCACVADAVDGGSSGAPDAGSLVSRDGHWRCALPPGNGCPAQRPPLGSECVRSMACDYGTCALERDLVFSCSNRVWIQTDSVQTCR